ncbi:phage protein NinX family protein [Hafnia paralvei]|uniref:phage protein NinX family protein n=1 Tax=Hafnia paralvei TaxID=546367 RepID=UPI003CE97A08
MTDYSKLSDDEINSRVAETLPIRFTYYADYIWNAEEECRFAPCNDPSDAWPIIVDNNIAIVPYRHTLPQAWPTKFGIASKFLVEDKNPLRAAMIVYLMMKESENG